MLWLQPGHTLCMFSILGGPVAIQLSCCGRSQGTTSAFTVFSTVQMHRRNFYVAAAKARILHACHSRGPSCNTETFKIKWHFNGSDRDLPNCIVLRIHRASASDKGASCPGWHLLKPWFGATSHAFGLTDLSSDFNWISKDS